MTSPIEYKFEITSDTLACTEPPKTPKKDSCAITIYKDNKNPNFVVQRQGKNFFIATTDEPRIKKAYPKYRLPLQELKDFIQIKKEFHTQFGDQKAPNTIVQGIKVLSQTQIFTILERLSNYISHGTLEPKSKLEKEVVEGVIASLVGSYADPTMGTLVEKVLKVARTNPRLSQEAKKRIEYIENIQNVREVFWEEMKPRMDQSGTLGDKLKKSSFYTLNFLMANHILADKGYKNVLFSQQTREVAKKYHEVISQIDPGYSISLNYYAFMANVLEAVKRKASLGKDYQTDFIQRINVAVQEFKKESLLETKRLLPQESKEKAFRISLILKYGTTPERKALLEIMLKHVKVKIKKGQPTYVVPMSSIDSDIRKWVKQLGPEQRKKAMKAILYVIDQTLERGEKMEAFWDGKEQKVPSFFGSESFGKGLFGGNNNKQLQELITWARGTAKSEGIPLTPDADPHVHFRKWTFMGELGVGALGIGTGFIPYNDPDANYYGHGASFILGGSGLGSAAGNALSYALDVNEYDWAFDLGGGVLGGLLGGLIYGLTTTKPGMMPGPTQPDDPGRRNPVDPYGP